MYYVISLYENLGFTIHAHTSEHSARKEFAGVKLQINKAIACFAYRPDGTVFWCWNVET